MKFQTTLKSLALLAALLGVVASGFATEADAKANNAEATTESGSQSSRADGFTQNITLRSKGGDAREVISQLFEQTGQEYVIEANVKQSIYLSISDVPFGTALDILSRLADVSFLKKQGIWYVVKARTAESNPGATSATAAQKITAPIKAADKKKAPTKNEADKEADTAPSQEQNPMFARNQRIQSPLAKRVLTRMTKADIRAVFTEFAMQTGVEIIVAEDVPNFKLDAFMIETSLKYALDEICKATKLKYQLTPGKTVLIRKA